MREREPSRGSLSEVSLSSLSLSLSLFSRVIGVRGPVVFVLGVSFPSLFCIRFRVQFQPRGLRAQYTRVGLCAGFVRRAISRVRGQASLFLTAWPCSSWGCQVGTGVGWEVGGGRGWRAHGRTSNPAADLITFAYDVRRLLQLAAPLHGSCAQLRLALGSVGGLDGSNASRFGRRISQSQMLVSGPRSFLASYASPLTIFGQ